MICKLRVPGNKYLNGKARNILKTPYVFLFSTHEQINVENMFICLAVQTVSIMHIWKENVFQDTQDKEIWLKKKEGNNCRIT